MAILIRQIILDTSALMQLTHEQLDKILSANEIFILSTVANELDYNKEAQDGNRSSKARSGLRWIEKNESKLRFLTSDDGDRETISSNDKSIIASAKVLDAMICTLDRGMWIRCKTDGVDIYKVSSGEKYNGYKHIVLHEQDDDVALANFFENSNDNVFDLIVNEYLLLEIIGDSGSKFCYYRWDGERYRDIHAYKMKGRHKNSLKPINHEQVFAFDLLSNPSMPIKFIVGVAGSGKTFLSVKILHDRMIEQGDFEKMVLVRNPTGSGENVGYLKGTLEDKIFKYFEVFTQHLDDNGYANSENMERRGALSKEIPWFMKGKSIDHSCIIVDESEDLTLKNFKMIGTRCGKGTEIVFLGDQNQSEDKYARHQALENAIDALKGDSLVGVVRFKTDERSNASRLFADKL